MDNNIRKNQEAPIMDLQQIGRRDLASIPEDELRTLGKQLILKSKSCGFVAFTNHGLPLQFVADHHKSANKFFNLPREEKLKNKRGMDTMQGFTDGDIENLDGNNFGAVDFKETFDLVDVNLPMPKQIPDLRTTGTQFIHSLWPFVEKLFRMVEFGLDWEAGTLNSLHRKPPNGVTVIRALRYPPTAVAAAGAIRCGAHKDISTFTLQFQSDVGGFQILQDNQWKNADGDVGIISFFFGETMELLSGNELQAGMHQVVATDQDIVRDRLSMAVFVHPDKEKNIRSYSGPIQYEPINSFEFLKQKLQVYYKDP